MSLPEETCEIEDDFLGGDLSDTEPDFIDQSPVDDCLRPSPAPLLEKVETTSRKLRFVESTINGIRNNLMKNELKLHIPKELKNDEEAKSQLIASNEEALRIETEKRYIDYLNKLSNGKQKKLAYLMENPSAVEGERKARSERNRQNKAMLRQKYRRRDRNRAIERHPEPKALRPVEEISGHVMSLVNTINMRGHYKPSKKSVKPLEKVDPRWSRKHSSPNQGVKKQNTTPRPRLEPSVSKSTHRNAALRIKKKKAKQQVDDEKKERIVFESESLGDYISKDGVNYDMLKQVLPLLDSSVPYVDIVVPTVIVIYQSFKSKSWTEVIAAYVQYGAAVGIPPSKVINFWKTVFGFDANGSDEDDKLCDEEFTSPLSEDVPSAPIDDHIRFESEGRASEALDKLQVVFGSVINSDFGNKMKDLTLALVSLKLFDKDISKGICSWLGKPRRVSVAELTSIILSAISTLVKYGEALISGVPMSNILLASDPIATLVSETQTLLRYTNFTYTGLPSPGFVERRQFKLDLERLLTTAVQLKKAISPFDGRTSVLANSIFELEQATAVMHRLATSTSRVMPMCVAIVGTPGIGKSELLKAMFSLWGEAKGRPFNYDQVYTKCKTTDFWECYNPLAHPYLHLSEQGNISREQARKLGDPTLTEFNSLVDTLPFQCNTAFTNKGTVFAAFDFIGLDTNNENMHIQDLMYSHTALFRRLLYVRFEVQPEFRLPNSTALDVKKSIAAVGNLLDRYIVTAYIRRPNGDKAFTEVILKKGGIGVVAPVLLEYFRDFISKQDALEVMRSESGGFSFTSKCDEDIKDSTDSCSSDDTFDTPLEDSDYEVAESRPEKKKKSTFRSVPSFESESDIEFTHSKFKDYSVGVFKVILMIFTFFTVTAWSEISSLLPRWITFRRERVVAILVILAFKVGGYFQHLLFILFLCSMIIDYGYCAETAFTYVVVSRLNARKVALKLRLRRLLCIDMKNPFETKTCDLALFGMKLVFSSLVGVAVGTVVGKAVGKAVNKVQQKSYDKGWKDSYNHQGSEFENEGEVSTFRTEDDANALIHELEESVNIQEPRVRIKTKYDQSWNEMHLGAVCPPKHTAPMVELYNCVVHNVRPVRVTSGDMSQKVHLFGIKGSLAVINTHALGDFDEVTMDICITGTIKEIVTTKQIKVKRSDCVPIGIDVTLFDTKVFQFRDITPHLFHGTVSGRMKGMCMGEEVNITGVAHPFVMSNKYAGETYGEEMWRYSTPNHGPGVCGNPLIGKIGGGCCIVGIHCGGNGGTFNAFGVLLNHDMVEKGMKKLIDRSPLMPILSFQMQSDIAFERPNPKSPFSYEPFHYLDYYGKMVGEVKIKRKSKLTRSPFGGEIENMLKKHLGYERSETYGPPVMTPFTRKITGEYVSPYNVVLRKMNKPAPDLDPVIMERCINELVAHIVGGLREKGITLSPITMEAAINGIAEDDYQRRINASTSAAFGYPGKKDSYIPIVEEKVDYVVREPVSKLKYDALSVVKSYARDKSHGFVYTAQLKDEPRLLEKVRTGATRVFYMSSMPNLILSRMFLSPFYTTMTEHGDLFSTAVGINMYQDADRLVRSMYDFSPYIMEGDYSGFDVSSPISIARAATTVVYRCLKELGYNDKALKMVQGLLTDSLFPIVSMNNDMFCKSGMQVSGKYGTAEDNNVRNNLSKMYAFYETAELQKYSYFECIKAMDYGDDTIVAVKEHVAHLFNNVTYAESCMRLYNMKFTSVSKGDVVDRFVTVDTMSFLKRRFTVHPCGKYIARLEIESIMKALEWYIPSKSISFEDQMLSTFESMIIELFFHCDSRDQYDAIRLEMRDIYQKHSGFSEVDFKTYDELATTFGLDYSDGSHGTTDPPCLDEKTEDGSLADMDENASITNGSIQFQTESWTMSDTVRNTRHARNNKDKLFSFQQEWKKVLGDVEAELQDEKDGLELNVLAFNTNLCKTPEVLVRNKKRKDLLLKKAAAVETLRVIDRIACRRLRFDSEADSGNDDGAISSGVTTTQENFTDVGGESTEYKDLGHADAPPTGQREVLTIDDFFARPVEIANSAVAVGGSLSAEYPVWDIVSKNPSVRAKFKNYAYFRGEMTIRVSVSGMKFHTGRILLSYQPHPLRNANLVAHLQNYAIGTTTYRPLVLAYLSQAPGAVIMEVNANRPVELKIPFISPKPMLRLYNHGTAAIAAAASFDDFENFGSLFVYTLNDIGSVSTGSSSVSYQIYAYLEDVDLGVPTATHLAITTESLCEPVRFESESDERVTGPMERASTLAATVSGALSHVPVLAPFAKASQLIFKGLAGVASWFGWSRPGIVSSPVFVKNRPFANSSNCIGAETIEKLSLDPKMEIAVDGHAVASETDDMVLSNIVARESYLTTFTWAATDAPGDIMYQCGVTPCLGTYYADAIGLNEVVQPTAMGFVASTFVWWRGTITFRLDIVKSAFHNGKIAVMFEPNHQQEVIISADVAFNKNFVQVIDIAETTSFEFEVQWAVDRPWLRVFPADDWKSAQAIGPIIANTSDTLNGFINIYPFTSLQSPDDSDIEINVFVRSDDMIFNQMSAVNLPTSRLFIQSESLIEEVREGLVHESTIIDYEIDVSFDASLIDRPENYFVPVTYETYFGKKQRAALLACKDDDWFHTIVVYDECGTPTHQEAVRFESESDAADVEVTHFVLNKSTASMSHCADYHFGEMPLSFRTLLKRYVTSFYDVTSTAASDSTVVYDRRKIYPDPQPAYNSTSSYPSIYGYIRYAFLGLRGCTRRRSRHSRSSANGAMNYSVVSLDIPASSTTEAVGTSAGMVQSITEGTVAFVPGTNGGVEVELPYYNPNLFLFSFATNLVGTQNDGEMETVFSRSSIARHECAILTGVKLFVSDEFSSGEDFTMMRFSGAPYYTYSTA